jgi:endonuclease I
MIKKFLALVFIHFICFAQAQIPPAYYENTEGLSGYNLKSVLHQIISEDHNPQSYSDVWSFFEVHDVKQDGTVWDVYADCDFDFGIPQDSGNQDVGTGGNTECEFFNREHVFPRSWFGGVSSRPEHSDIINLLPVDKLINIERAAYVFANVSNPDFVSTNGSKKGTSTTIGFSGTAFEIIDDYKGDIARIFFYMATRYENEISSWEGNNVEGDNYLNGTSDQVYYDWVIDLLYEWHINDPVDQKEIDRNNAIYLYQGNRNPFVDIPEFVCAIWDVDESNCTFSNASYDLKNELVIYPNPVVSSSIYIESIQPIDQLFLYSTSGQLVRSIDAQFKQNSYEISGLDTGIYILKVVNNNKTFTNKVVVN